MLDDKTTSLRQHSIRYSIIILVVILLAAVLHYFLFSKYLHNLEDEEHQKVLVSVSNSVSRAIGFYQTLVNELSEQPLVRTLIEFGSDEQVQQWANSMQRMVPDSIGFTVFKKDGKVKGLREQMRLGPACFRDMQKRLHGADMGQPAIHRGIKGLEHFDVISDVVLGEDKIGIAFSSFSIDIMARLLDDVSTKNKAYRLLDSTGFVIAKTQNLDMQRNVNQMLRSPIKGTDWQLEMYVYEGNQNVLMTSLLLSNFITFILVSVILYYAMSRLINVVLSDFETVGHIMTKIKNGTFTLDQGIQPRLKETRGIIHFMHYTAEELSNYQKQLEHESTTDALTGLHNRRVLNQHLDRLLEPENNDEKSHLLIIDIDFFKEINDTYGHDVGDQVLLMFSDALGQFTSDEDISTRAGGDEFIVILHDYNAEQVRSWYDTVKTHMNHQVGQYNRENNLGVEFGLSVGCTLIRANDIKGAVLKRADEALYRVKMSGRNNIECV